MGDWPALEQDIAEAERLKQQLEQSGADEFEWTRLRALLAIGRGELNVGAAMLETNILVGAESSQINWHTYQAWLARRRGQPMRAAAIADQVLAQPGTVPQARAILALEGDIAAWEAGIERSLHSETKILIGLRIRSHLIRLRVLLALRCWQTERRRARHHLVQAYRSIGQPPYRLLLTDRDPELGKRFWALLLVADLANDEALAKLQAFGDPEPLLTWLRDPEPSVRLRIARAVGALKCSQAIPALAAAITVERDVHVVATLQAALNDLERLPPPLLDLRLMGTFEVWRDGVVVPSSVWPRPIVRRLLQYFALHRGVTLSRDRILGDLWPEGDRDGA